MGPERIAPTEALRWMVDGTVQSAYFLSRRLGRCRTWLSNLMGRDPHLSTLATVAAETGCAVAIVDGLSHRVLAIVDAPDRVDLQRDHIQ